MLARENINEVYMYTSTCIGHDDSEVDEPNNVLSWCLLVFGIYVSIYLSTWIVLSGPSSRENVKSISWIPEIIVTMKVVIKVKRQFYAERKFINKSCHAWTSNCALTCVKLAGLNVVCYVSFGRCMHSLGFSPWVVVRMDNIRTKYDVGYGANCSVMSSHHYNIDNWGYSSARKWTHVTIWLKLYTWHSMKGYFFVYHYIFRTYQTTVRRFVVWFEIS